MRRIILCLLFAVLAVPAACERASADFYKYVDNEGVVHITNVPTSSRYTWMMREKHDKPKPGPSRAYSSGSYEDIIYLASKIGRAHV